MIKLLFGLFLMLSCASRAYAPAPSVRIEVRNDNWGQATVTMISPSQGRRVVGRLQTNERLVRRMPLRSNSLRFHIHLLAGETYVTEEVVLSPSKPWCSSSAPGFRTRPFT